MNVELTHKHYRAILALVDDALLEPSDATPLLKNVRRAINDQKQTLQKSPQDKSGIRLRIGG